MRVIPCDPLSSQDAAELEQFREILLELLALGQHVTTLGGPVCRVEVLQARDLVGDAT